MAEPIEILFGFWTQVGRMKHRQCGLKSNYIDQLYVSSAAAAAAAAAISFSLSG